MAVHLIIDGYNLIRQSARLSRLDARDLEEGREALLEALAVYRRSRPLHRLTVVFDGWQAGEHKESRDLVQGVQVIFSRRGERADDVIKRLLLKEGSRALVVSSDRELQACAAGAGAAWVGASHFESVYLWRAPRNSFEEADDHSQTGVRKKGPGRRRSKRERQRQQRLKKL